MHNHSDAIHFVKCKNQIYKLTFEILTMSSFNNKRNKPKLYSLLESSEITGEADNKIELDVTEPGNNRPLPHSIKTQIPLNIENPTSLKNTSKKAKSN